MCGCCFRYLFAVVKRIWLKNELIASKGEQKRSSGMKISDNLHRMIWGFVSYCAFWKGTDNDRSKFHWGMNFIFNESDMMKQKVNYFNTKSNFLFKQSAENCVNNQWKKLSSSWDFLFVKAAHAQAQATLTDTPSNWIKYEKPNAFSVSHLRISSHLNRLLWKVE